MKNIRLSDPSSIGLGDLGGVGAQGKCLDYAKAPYISERPRCAQPIIMLSPYIISFIDLIGRRPRKSGSMGKDAGNVRLDKYKLNVYGWILAG